MAAVAAFLVMGPVSGAPAERARSTGTGSGIELVAEIPFDNGTHLETATIQGRDYAFASEITTGAGKLRVIDISAPEKPKVVATLPCNGNQGNLQLSHDQKTLVIGIDVPSDGGCMPAGLMGFVTVDISSPKRPKVLGYAEIARGSHSLAAHPKKPFVYNGDGFPEAPGEMQVWSIENPVKPKLVTTVDTGVHSPHDLAFNRTGSMLATANAVNLHLMDTSNPSEPVIEHTTQCPGCLHTHEARFTPDSKRLIVNDEHPNNVCPGGALYFYDVTGTSGAHGLTLTGAYTGTEVGVTGNNSVPTKCTPHIFDISNDGTKVAATWHQGGLKYLDVTATAGVTMGARTIVPGGPTELGWYVTDGGYTFAAKIHTGPYIYVVDTNVGFQVFKISSQT